MFRLFPNEVVKKIFEKTPNHEDQARLAQVNTQFNKISQDETLELNKYKSGCTVHSVGHTHVVLQKSFLPSATFPFHLHAMKGNVQVLKCSMHVDQKKYEEFKGALQGNTVSLINNFKSWGLSAKLNGMLLEKALEQERCKQNSLK